MEKVREYTISYIDKDLLISNINESQLYIEVINTSKNYGAYRWTIDKNFSQEFSNKPNKINLGLPRGKDSNYYFDRIHITDRKTFFDIYLIEEDKKLIKLPLTVFHPSFPLVCICGHSGGGTSIITKSLNYLGLHIGEDSGNFSNRKAHESISLRTYLLHCFPNIKEEFLLTSLQSVFSSYKYDFDKINAFKLADLENGNLALKLSRTFSNLKFLSIVKPKSRDTFSLEGERFNSTEELDIYKQQHPTVENSLIFHLDWNKYFTDHMYVNKVLNYLGLNVVLDESSFNKMLKDIEFDNSRLL